MSDSLYADYIREREGSVILSEPWGFVEFKIEPPVCLIQSIYVVPEERMSGKGTELADRVTHIAADAGCKTLWSQVWVNTLNPTLSLKAILGYGFTLQRADNGIILLTKDIKTEVE